MYMQLLFDQEIKDDQIMIVSLSDAFLSNENIVWDLTSNCNVSSNGHCRCKVRLLWQKRKSDRNDICKTSRI